MAWRCSASSNSDLIRNLQSSNLVKSPRVAAAMNSVDRAHYVPRKDEAYQDSPASIGFGATISAPHIHAYALENLLPFLQPGSKVLDVGSGSGYLLGCFHELISGDGRPFDGKVVGIDHLSGITDLSIKNLKKDGRGDALSRGEIEVVTGDGRKGYPSEGPYSAIHVGAAAPIVPSDLLDQLARPGRMFIPVGTYSQDVLQVDKSSSGEVTTQKLFGVRYIPLTDASEQWS
ncbi:Pcmt1-prov protein [Mrakia frigida]|uniref:Pcmt1-prov protein n=1 Tax=Mrakia frigida TaxID=29902 RepID=UPI003FCC1FDE